MGKRWDYWRLQFSGLSGPITIFLVGWWALASGGDYVPMRNVRLLNQDCTAGLFHCIPTSKMWQYSQKLQSWNQSNEEISVLKTKTPGTSLVAQWLRICLPVQGTRVQALVQEDPTCCGATKPVRHNYWAYALEPASHNSWAHMLQLLQPTHLGSVLCNKRSHCPATKSSPRSPQLEKARMQQRRPNAAKKKKNNKKTPRVLRMEPSLDLNFPLMLEAPKVISWNMWKRT